MNWHHVAMTRSGTTGSWTIRFYIDGALDSTVGTAVNPNASPTNLFIGKRIYQLGIVLTAPWTGHIFPFALDTVQIAQLRTDGLGASQNAADGVGGPTVIQSEETAVGQFWNLSMRLSLPRHGRVCDGVLKSVLSSPGFWCFWITG